MWIMMIISLHTKGGSRDGVFSLRKPFILRCPFLYFPIIPWGKDLPSGLIQCIWSIFRGWHGLTGLTITYVSSNCHTVDILWYVQVFYHLISYLEYICICKVFHALVSFGAFGFSAIKATTYNRIDYYNVSSNCHTANIISLSKIWYRIQINKMI